jgi:hypothetical protein
MAVDPAPVIVDPDRPASRPCTWCARPVPIIRRPGRPRLYCNHGCRQRAYEHRHGFCHVRSPRELPGQLDDAAPSQSTGYESGGYGYGGRIVHALRTCVRPEGQRRETLCGLLAAPSGRPFSTLRPHSCKTCSSVALAAPLRHPVEPSNELARLRAVIEETVEVPVPVPFAWDPFVREQHLLDGATRAARGVRRSTTSRHRRRSTFTCKPMLIRRPIAEQAILAELETHPSRTGGSDA